MFVRLTTRMHNRAKEALEAAPRPARRGDRRPHRPAARDRAGLPGPGGRPRRPPHRGRGPAAARRGHDRSPAARRTRRSPATTTCRCSRASTRASGRPSCASSSTPPRSPPRRTAPSRRRSPSCWRTAPTATRSCGSWWRRRGRSAAPPPRPLDLSFVGEKWWPLLTGRTAREPAPVEVDRRYFEICLFTQVVNELKSGDLCIPGSEEYGDYRDQLVSWEEYRRDVAAYAEQAGVPADPKAFVAGLKAKLAETAAAVDRAFPDNEHVEIVGGEPVVKRLRAGGGRGRRAPGAAAQGAHGAGRHPGGAGRHRALARLDPALRPGLRLRGQARPPARALPRHRLLLRLRPRPDARPRAR